MTDALKSIGAEKFTSVVTDNASAMVKAREKLLQEFPNQKIASYGCVAHILKTY